MGVFLQDGCMVPCLRGADGVAEGEGGSCNNVLVLFCERAVKLVMAILSCTLG